MAGKIKDLAKGLYANFIGPFYQQPAKYLNIKQIGDVEVAKIISDAIGSDKVQVIALRKWPRMPWDAIPSANPVSVKDAFEYLMNESLEADALLTGIHIRPAVFGFKEKGYGIFGDSEMPNGKVIHDVVGIDIIPYKE